VLAGEIEGKVMALLDMNRKLKVTLCEVMNVLWGSYRLMPSATGMHALWRHI
jgi:hypothetical protein